MQEKTKSNTKNNNTYDKLDFTKQIQIYVIKITQELDDLKWLLVSV